MKNRLLLVTALSVSLLSAGFAYQSKPVQYEYKIQYDASEKKLNDLAAQGWEVVAVGAGGTSVTVPVFVLKRPRQ